MPSWGMSRSRNVRTKPCLHREEARSCGARYARGKPPRIQRVRHAPDPISERPKPDRSTRPTRPARDSETPRTSEGDALPSTRNRAGLPARSISTRRVSNSAGSRCISSMITRPDKPANACSGACSRRRSTALSRSRNVLPGVSAAMARASVVLPHWRGPVRATAGWTENASRMRARATGRSMVICHRIP